MQSSRRALLLLAMHLPTVSALAADDPPPFDRPGAAFNTSVFELGQGAWEQGVPSFSVAHDAASRTSSWWLDTRMRVGLGHGIELQWAQNVVGSSRTCINGAACMRAHGRGDGAIALKWSLPERADATTHWGVLLTHKLTDGTAPLGGPGRADQFAVSMARNLSDARSLGASLAHDITADGQGWLGSVNVAFPCSPTITGYVEAVGGSGIDHARAIGAGAAWMASTRVQLDGWMLRGLDAPTPDWQGGVGISVAFGRKTH